MTSSIEGAFRVLRIVAERTDPTSPIGTGAIARALGWSASSASRSCAALARVGLLAPGEVYGSYRLGREAIRLSGRAAARVALPVRYALTIAAQTTGETACVAARSGDTLHVVASVGSEWTLHAAADVGEPVADESAIARANAGEVGSSATHPRIVESRTERVVEVASAVLGPDGECVAVVAVRLPLNRSTGGVPRARRAVDAARRRIETMIAAGAGEPHPHPVAVAVGGIDVESPASALDAAVRVLGHLADGHDSLSGTARSVGLRTERVQRLLTALERAGVVSRRLEGDGVGVCWGVHAWHRAATAPILTSAGRRMVAQTATDAGVYGFITVLKGIRSFTVVEEVGEPDGGLVMMPWLGRPHPVIGSDGGPTLVMEFEPADLSGLIRKRHSEHDLSLLMERMRVVSRDGVISIDSDDDAGLLSVSAPVRDASGAVAAAACLTGATDAARPRRAELELATRDLATRLSDLLGG